jgi:phage baseplate assembly protein W
MSATFKGFSTVDQIKPPYTLRDLELVKRDLTNHIHTRRGERVMMPNFGTNIPLYIFEPKTRGLLETIESELLEVFNADPRVEFIGMNINEKEHLVELVVELQYVPGDISDVLYLNFTEES